MEKKSEALTRVAREASAWGDHWHRAGTFRADVLEGLALHLAKLEPGFSLETGVGKSTILFSQWAKKHVVFALDDTHHSGSYPAVRDSSLLKPGVVEFVLGPSQKTLPKYDIREPLQAVLLDGPHGYPFPELEYYYVYPHLREGALLIVDDIQIPTIHHLFSFLREDPMFRLVDVLYTTAVFQRTSAPLFDPTCDGWFDQEYNIKRVPMYEGSRGISVMDYLKGLVPYRLKQKIKARRQLK